MSNRKLEGLSTIMLKDNEASPPGTIFMVPGDLTKEEAERLVERGSARWVVDEAAIREEAAMAEKANRDKLQSEIEAELRPKIEKELRSQVEAELRPKIEKELRSQIEAELKASGDGKPEDIFGNQSPGGKSGKGNAKK